MGVLFTGAVEAPTVGECARRGCGARAALRAAIVFRDASGRPLGIAETSYGLCLAHVCETEPEHLVPEPGLSQAVLSIALTTGQRPAAMGVAWYALRVPAPADPS